MNQNAALLIYLANIFFYLSFIHKHTQLKLDITTMYKVKWKIGWSLLLLFVFAFWNDLSPSTSTLSCIYFPSLLLPFIDTPSRVLSIYWQDSHALAFNEYAMNSLICKILLYSTQIMCVLRKPLVQTDYWM